MGGHFRTTLLVKLCEKNSGCCVNDHLVQICLPIKDEGEEEYEPVRGRANGAITGGNDC